MHDKYATAFTKHARELDALRAEKQAQHQGITQRLDGLERCARRPPTVRLRPRGRENHGSEIGKLQRSHGALVARKEELASGHATMDERAGYLEQMLSDSVEKHAKELRELRDSHSKQRITSTASAACTRSTARWTNAWTTWSSSWAIRPTSTRRNWQS